MRQQSILLSFIPGFASILIYIIVEAIFGETAGLIAGLVLGIGEFTVILFRERRVDTFTLVDTILLAIMGAISLALSDPVFFRLKPAISGVILSIPAVPIGFFYPICRRNWGWVNYLRLQLDEYSA